jgi:hypothetical protein
LLLVVTRIRSMRDAIPYGPFLVIGGVFALFWGQPVVDDYLERFQEARTVQTALARADLGMLAVDSDLGQSSIGYAWLREIGDYESIESS